MNITLWALQVLLALAQVMGGGWRVVAQEAWKKLRANSR